MTSEAPQRTGTRTKNLAAMSAFVTAARLGKPLETREIRSPGEVSAADLAPLADCEALETLQLDTCTGHDPTFVASVPSPRELRIGSCRSATIDGPELRPELRALELSPRDGCSLRPLGAPTELKSLVVHRSPDVRDAAVLEHPTNLVVLRLERPPLPSLGWARPLHQLEELSVPTTAQSLDALARTRRLRRLTLEHSLAKGVAPLVQSTGLELVRLAFFPELVDVSPVATLPSPRSLSFERCPEVTDVTALNGRAEPIAPRRARRGQGARDQWQRPHRPGARAIRRLRTLGRRVEVPLLED